MHILIGLVIATVLIILWLQGNLFACVFLTLPAAGGGVLGLLLAVIANTMEDRNLGAWMIVASAAALAAIWVPRQYLLHRNS